MDGIDGRGRREREGGWRGPLVRVPVGRRSLMSSLPLVVTMGLLVAACGEESAPAEPSTLPPATVDVEAERSLLGEDEELHFDEVADWTAAADLEATYGVSWPASSRDIDLFQGGLQDPYYLARLTIDEDDLEQLLAPATCQELTAGSPGSGLMTPPEWWTPGESTQTCSGVDGERHQSVGVAPAETSAVTVYLSVFFIG